MMIYRQTLIYFWSSLDRPVPGILSMPSSSVAAAAAAVVPAASPLAADWPAAPVAAVTGVASLPPGMTATAMLPRVTGSSPGSTSRASCSPERGGNARL
jgi:hypothetical protein